MQAASAPMGAVQGQVRLHTTTCPGPQAGEDTLLRTQGHPHPLPRQNLGWLLGKWGTVPWRRLLRSSTEVPCWLLAEAGSSFFNNQCQSPSQQHCQCQCAGRRLPRYAALPLCRIFPAEIWPSSPFQQLREVHQCGCLHSRPTPK